MIVNKTVWPSGLRRLTRNQVSSEAAVQIRQLSDYLLDFFWVLGLDFFYASSSFEYRVGGGEHCLVDCKLVDIGFFFFGGGRGDGGGNVGQGVWSGRRT